MLPYIPFLLFLLWPAESCFQSIISFGDSIADTGNFVHTPGGDSDHAAHIPYGETCFKKPTGRYSNGRLIVDFIAEAVGVPFLPPVLGGSSHGFRYGVNFAVGGATALDTETFREKGWYDKYANYSLGAQVKMFKNMLPSVCNSDSECKKFLSKSLFLVGEIGGNDYNHPFILGINFKTIRSLVPQVIDTISSAISELITMGARTLVVPGNLPIGCVPMYLSHLQSKSDNYYDTKTGCIKWLNEFSEYHNSMLLHELNRLREKYPYATIIYADYYNAALSIIRSPKSFGIESTLKACCGGGDGPYNVGIFCGDKGSNLCDDPSKYMSWDGLHFTEAAYKAIANKLLDGSFMTPPMNYECPPPMK